MIKSLAHLTSLLGYSLKEIEQVLADVESNHYHFQQPKAIVKGVITYRHFHPSKRNLRDLQNRIHTNVFSKIDLPSHLHGGIRGRGNVTSSRPHQGKLYKFHTDLKSYFDFVSNKMVYDSLVTQGFSQKVSNILTRATTFRGHLAQGPPTSPFLANLVGLSMDLKLKDLCIDHKITYTRFVDDLCFSSELDFKQLLPSIISIINSSGFYIGYKKTKYKKGRIIVTGVDIGQNNLRPPKKLLEKYMDPETPEHTKRGLAVYFAGMKQKSPKANKN